MKHLDRLLKDVQVILDKITTIEQEIPRISPQLEKQVLTNKEMLSYLGVSRNQAYQWRKTGELKFYQKGRSIFYFLEDIKTFIKSQSNDLED
jgi:predicted DNA-binding transcriptional regulator AlpA